MANSNRLNAQALYAVPVEGGRQANGALLYITRVKYDGGVHTAKAGEHLPGAQLAFNGTEVLIEVSNRLMVWSVRSVCDTVAATE